VTLPNSGDKSTRLLAAALVAAFLLPGLRARADQPDCLTTPEAEARVFSRVHDAAEHTLRGAEAKAFMDRLNALPPATDYTADEVMIFTAPSKQPYALLVTLEKGCVNRHGNLPLEELRQILRPTG
jgi:hypothetical protein